MNTADTVTVTLSKPITYEGKTITELVLNEATAGDACLADSVQGDATKLLAIISGMCGQPLPALKLLKMTDYNAVLAKAVPLMGEPQQPLGGSTP